MKKVMQAKMGDLKQSRCVDDFTPTYSTKATVTLMSYRLATASAHAPCHSRCARTC